MKPVITLTQTQLSTFLLNVAIVRPVFIWGPPGIGKSSIVQEFAADVGLECVSLLGSQLAPEDIIGVPQIIDGKSRFCPPAMIAREEPYCLFLDELNACSHEVQKSFYSLIHERRVGDYHLPEGSIVVGAGNRAQDSAIVKPMSSALLNRMVHVQMQASATDWLAWAYSNDIHSWILKYIEARPDHLWVQPPKTEEPFSSPRAWHMLSDALHQFGDSAETSMLEALMYGTLSAPHAGQFKAFIKQIRNQYDVNKIIKGEERWPDKPDDRDVLYFLAQSFRAQLVRELPSDKKNATGKTQALAHRAKALIKQLALISFEIAQIVVSNEDAAHLPLPDWFMVEIARDLPRIIIK
ncbi:MAG: AAA family ATPase [Candidatus Promineifilaceae bacterium]